MGRVAGKVAFITGAARGQGRAHAVRLAEEGADIIAVDICGQIDTVPFAMSTKADLEETERLVKALGRRIVSAVVDVRDLAALQAAVADGVSQLGRLDIVVANAGISSTAMSWEMTEQMWQDLIDVNLTGVWKTAKATVPWLIEQGQGGSLVLISSVQGVVGNPTTAHYVSAKHGMVGLMRTLAIELAPHMIRANTIHPGSVNTPMINNDWVFGVFSGGKAGASLADAEDGLRGLNAMPVTWMDAEDISNAVLYFASDESRYVTGTTHVVDAGQSITFKIGHDHHAIPTAEQ